LKIRKGWAAGYAVIAALCLARAGLAADVPSAPADRVRDRPQAEKQKDGKEPGAGMPAPEVSSGATGTEKMPEALEPLFVRPLMKIEPGRNDSNPQWSPQGSLIAFERSVGDKKEIHITLSDGTEVQTVYFQLSDGGDTKFFFPGVYEETSYNAGITWSPGEDRFVFMSNGGEGKYDLYLQELGEKTTARLTSDKEKDGQAHWSPVSDAIVFVSGRTGNGDIYLLDLRSKALTRLTQGGKAYLYPRWSPDGKKIVMMHGSSENHDIVLIADPARPMGSLTRLTTWPQDDLRPTWSPDGRKIAFYSNYNADGDPKVWSLFVVAADGSDPTEGDGLAAKMVAADVIPDMDTGPAWMPDSARILYVKNERQEFNPLYLADVAQKTSRPIKTDTKMNHDVTCSSDGAIAFRALVNQWDQIYIMRLKQ
jgi:Tol biopolymer transport system component